MASDARVNLLIYLWRSLCSFQSPDSFSFGLGDDLKLTTENVSSSSIEGLHIALEDANTKMREDIR